jgi:hypothetical protein
MEYRTGFGEDGACGCGEERRRVPVERRWLRSIPEPTTSDVAGEGEGGDGKRKGTAA